MKIRRPGVLVLSFYGAGIFFGRNFWIPTAAVLLVGLTAFAVFFIFWRNRRVSCCCLGVLLLLGGVLTFNLHRDAPSAFVEEQAGGAWLKTEEAAAMEGIILSVESRKSGDFQAVARVGKEKALLRISGEIPEPWDLAGRRVRFSGRPSIPETARNPGVFDYRLYLRTREIRIIFDLEFSQMEVDDAPLRPFRLNWIWNGISRIRGHFIDTLSEKTSGETAGFIAGMTLGEIFLLEEERYEAFQKNGVAHSLAISGFHMAVVYECMAGLLRKRGKWVRTGCCALGLLFYGALSGFSVSAVRAMVMIYLKLLAGLLHRRYDLISAACWTAVGFLIFNPYTLFHTGFLLSFTAVLSLAVIGGGLERSIREKMGKGTVFRTKRTADGTVFRANQDVGETACRANQDVRGNARRANQAAKGAVYPKEEKPLAGRLLSMAAPVLGIQLGLLPLTAYCFNYFSPAAFVANIPVLFLAGIIIPAGIVLIPLSFLGGSLSVLFEGGAMALGVWIKWMEAANTLSGLGPLSFQYVPSPSPWMMALYYIGLILIFSEVKFTLPGGKKSRLFLFLLCLALCFPQTVLENRLRPQVVFVDVGQGDCIHIRTAEGKNLLVDGGGSADSDYDVGKKILLPYLLKNGVSKIDGAVITHMDADHYLGIASIAREIPVDCFYFSGAYQKEADALTEIFEAEGDRIQFLWEGDGLHLGEGIEMTVLHPKKNGSLMEEENEKSLVLSLDYQGVQLLLTGDIGEETEKLLKPPNGCDILKVAHHGSKYSSSHEFLSKLNPRAAVIQVGKGNHFGHPAPSIVERYEKKGIMVYRNDEDGAVFLWIRDGTFQLSAMLPDGRRLPRGE